MVHRPIILGNGEQHHAILASLTSLLCKQWQYMPVIVRLCLCWSPADQALDLAGHSSGPRTLSKLPEKLRSYCRIHAARKLNLLPPGLCVAWARTPMPVRINDHRSLIFGSEERLPLDQHDHRCWLTGQRAQLALWRLK